MKKKLNIIQFLPYFPPHKGGLESVGKEISEHWVNASFGNCINIITSFNQEEEIQKKEKIIFKGEQIGYKDNGVENLVVPSFEIINNFPCYKFSNKQKDLVFEYVSLKLKTESGEKFVVITHTRFFLTTLIGGIFAKGSKLKWVHIEHGSDYVKLGSRFKSYIAYLYDRVIGKCVFKKADKVLAISEASKRFIEQDFESRKINIFYRGLIIPNKIEILENLKEKFAGKIIVGYIGRLYKWKNVDGLIKAFNSLNDENLQLVIVGDGEELENLKREAKNNNKIYFAGGRSSEEALSYQKQFDIHIHPSLPGGGLATTLLQAMCFGCIIVATPNEGAREVIFDSKNGILVENDSVEELRKGVEKALKSLDKKEVFAKENMKIIIEKFNWEKNILSLYELIK